MAKKRARRTAIVPAIVLSTAIAGGLCVTPTIVGCSDGGPQLTVAQIGFDVAATGFDIAIPRPGLDVAFSGFDLSRADGELPD